MAQPLIKINYRRVHAALNRRLDTFAGGRLARWCQPSAPTLLLTERCNARCLHCDIWKNQGREDRPQLREWKVLMSDLRQWLGPVHVVLTGGEALLNPDTIELVAHGRTLGLWVELLSHGYWKDQEKIRALVNARPARVTISLDSVSKTHNLIRGRDDFLQRTIQTIETLASLRTAEKQFEILLKTVIMQQNLAEVSDVAEFAAQQGLEVFYQPIEQNYNTPENALWFDHNETWPADTEAAVSAVKRLIELKTAGLPIANSLAQLEVMIPYFRNPGTYRVAVQSHTAHESIQRCSAATMLQIQANGDVTICTAKPPVGNIRTAPIKTIWSRRPRWWQEGCCLEQRLGDAPPS